MSGESVSVFLYVPNIIGYVRGFLTVCSFVVLNCGASSSFVAIYTAAIIMDGLDGYLARLLDQCSRYGAWLDVVIDNLGRTLLWAHVHPVTTLMSALEWTVFVCNHQLGDNWQDKLIDDQFNCRSQYQEYFRQAVSAETKVLRCQSCGGSDFVPTTRRDSAKVLQNAATAAFIKPPLLVQRIMKNNFRTLWGAWAVAGLHVLPLWLLSMQLNVFNNSLSFLPSWVPFGGLTVLVAGRILCFYVELWCIWKHMVMLTSLW